MKSQNITLNQLLERSAELACRLALIIGQEFQSSNSRSKVVHDLCVLAEEHSKSVRLLLGSENFNSATAQLRIHYEAVLRSVWIHFSAPKSAVKKLMGALSQEDLARRADNLPTAKEMLDQLEASGKVPCLILRPLLCFRAEMLKESNAAVHSGPHAIYLHRSGYPEPLLVQRIQASNDLLVATARLQVALSGSRAQREELALIGVEFASCLPAVQNGCMRV
ncbi:hypothetical protein [Haloferula sp. BvORR071]|uniref:DUF6988 family protein n=1 Tax=Haloferula sp. BvORR071 TaxID=1396141 RepID=UPI0005519BCA|nr:hypothetical protein [Haloferula sp. BvORR071]